MTKSNSKYLFRLAICFVMLSLLACTKSSNTAYEEILDLYNKIDIEMTVCDVALVFCKSNYMNLRILYRLDFNKISDINSETFIIKTPTRIGAANALLYINTYQNIVTSVKMRTEDSVERKPKTRCC